MQTLTGQSGEPGGGPFIILTLTEHDGRIVDSTFDCNGCPASQKAAAGIATFARGRTPEQLSRMDPESLLVLIGGLPDGQGGYAQMATEALLTALSSATRSS